MSKHTTDKVTHAARFLQQTFRDLARGIDRIIDPAFVVVLLLAMAVALLLGWNPTGTDR